MRDTDWQDLDDEALERLLLERWLYRGILGRGSSSSVARRNGDHPHQVVDLPDRRVLCAIQAVAIEPPRLCASKRLDTASIAPASGSVALLFHRSRIIRASPARSMIGTSSACSRSGLMIAAIYARQLEGLGKESA